MNNDISTAPVISTQLKYISTNPSIFTKIQLKNYYIISYTQKNLLTYDNVQKNSLKKLTFLQPKATIWIQCKNNCKTRTEQLNLVEKVQAFFVPFQLKPTKLNSSYIQIQQRTLINNKHITIIQPGGLTHSIQTISANTTRSDRVQSIFYPQRLYKTKLSQSKQSSLKPQLKFNGIQYNLPLITIYTCFT
eukprot:TRINITY_DN7718_c0_g1_i6.p1 TRINITY_DN7718_c0_g1~~TRINITY_DN7718_c0_g1_i6.p1  ORF type:complete len:190 (+),score=-17.40 TRINITY_DN7718_c0_g1_i6:513-1082(+)